MAWTSGLWESRSINRRRESKDTHLHTEQLLRYGSQLNSLPNYGLPTRVINLMQWCNAYKVLYFWWVSNIGYTDSFKELQERVLSTSNLLSVSLTAADIIVSQAETSGCVRQLVSDFLRSVTDDEIVTSVDN